MTRPWITVALMVALRPWEARQILMASRAFGIDLGQAALAWLATSVAGTVLSALTAVVLYFAFGIDASGLLLASLIFGISFFVSLAVYGMSYLFAVESVTIWLDLLVVVLVLVGTAGLLLLGE